MVYNTIFSKIFKSLLLYFHETKTWIFRCPRNGLYYKSKLKYELPFEKFLGFFLYNEIQCKISYR
jgi:hypothetical protein